MFIKCYLHFVTQVRMVKRIGKGRCNGSLKYRYLTCIYWTLKSKTVPNMSVILSRKLMHSTHDK